jgi:hypothetical protein
MTSPDLLFLNQLDMDRIHVNEKPYENKTFGFTYNYLNYQGVKDLEVQMPMYLSSNIGIKCWENDSGNSSYSSMVQFPCIDGRQFDEDGTVKLLPENQIPMKYDPIKKEMRPRKRTEIEREFATFKQFCLIEDRVREQAKITNDLRKFTWNGVIQVRNKRDKEDNIIEGEFHPPSIKFQIGTKKTNRNEIDLICTDKTTGQEVDYTEVLPYSTMNIVFTLGRIHRKIRSVPQPCGLHMYMTRVMFYPPSADTREDEAAAASNDMDVEKRRSNRFLALPGDDESDTETVIQTDFAMRDEHDRRMQVEASESPMIESVC